MFGDTPANFGKMSDGLSNTFVFGEKYATMTGGPFGACANLWGYGVDPRSIPNDFNPPLGPASTPARPSGRTAWSPARCTTARTTRGTGS